MVGYITVVCLLYERSKKINLVTKTIFLMKKMNLYVLKSFGVLIALSFVLLGLTSSFQSANAQNSSPLPKLVQISEAISILTVEMDELALKSQGDPANLTAGEQERMRMMGAIRGELTNNKDFVGYKTEYAVHLAATQAVFNQLQQGNPNAEVALDPFTWIRYKYDNDPEYRYVVQKLKL